MLPKWMMAFLSFLLLQSSAAITARVFDGETKWHCKEYLSHADCISGSNAQHTFELQNVVSCHSTKTQIENITLRSYALYDDNPYSAKLTMFTNPYCIDYDDSQGANGTIQFYSDCDCRCSKDYNTGIGPCSDDYAYCNMDYGRIGCVTSASVQKRED